MVNKNNHPECPRCKGEGFYLAYEGQGYYSDGSFGHNRWEDCFCSPLDKPEHLPEAVDPRPERIKRMYR